MRRFWIMIATIGLGSALLVGGVSDAWAWRGGGWRGGGWHGGGWHGGGWRGGWHGAGWRGGWHGVGWRGGWGWNRGWGGWGWNRGWGWRGGWWPAYAGLGLGWAATSPYWGSGWGWGYGWPSSSYYSYSWPYDSYYGAYGTYQPRPYYAYTQTAPLVTGRSVATGSIGMHCATSVKTCLLRNASYIGGGCSCKVSGGRARGTVTP